jgi:phage replication-related protein YjqB (UPF0714/DUF867 family)
MPDRYSNFSALAQVEVRDRDFSVRHKQRRGANAIIAPHGGGIEPGTSELAEAIADDDLSFYTFEGKKPRGNSDLHITSTRFDEPECLALLAKSPICITVHGEGSSKEVIFMGGLDNIMACRIRISLQRHRFRVEVHNNKNLKGTEQVNICNRGTTGRGVQLELSEGLRQTFFENLTRKGREVKEEPFHRFVAAVREAIVEAQ